MECTYYIAGRSGIDCVERDHDWVGAIVTVLTHLLTSQLALLSYGLITAIVIVNQIVAPTDTGVGQYSLYTGFAHLAAGLACGLAGLGSGMAIGLAGEAGVRSIGYFDFESKRSTSRGGGMQFAGAGKSKGGPGKKKAAAGGADQLFVAMVLIQVFAGNLALYGLITSIILTQTGYVCGYN